MTRNLNYLISLPVMLEPNNKSRISEHRGLPPAIFLLLGIASACGPPAQMAAIAQAPNISTVDVASLDQTEIEDRATNVIHRFCSSCHGVNQQEGNVILTQLETLDAITKQETLAKVQEVLQLSEMPPDDSPQLASSDYEIIEEWLKRQLTGAAAKSLAEKLQRFEFGNAVKHRDLFSGKHEKEAAYTLDRRWLISEYIFNEKINRLLNYRPTRAVYGVQEQVQGDSGVHWSPKTEWGNKFRRTITNPFLLPSKVGVRYSGHDRLTTGHLLTMVGNAKRVANHMTSETVMKANYPEMYAFMKGEIEYRETIRQREAFLRNFAYMEQLLKEIYGEEHERLLPKLERQEIPYPGPPEHSANGIQKRHENLEFLDRFEKADIEAVLRGIRRYKLTEFSATENPKMMRHDKKGNPVWSPYSEADYAEYDQIIGNCERDWFTEGVSQYRIKNRIVTMKLMFDTWDMNRLFSHIANGNYKTPGYQPLSSHEMDKLRNAIQKQRKKGDHYLEIAEKCLEAWRTERSATQAAVSSEDDHAVQSLIIELFEIVFERVPTDVEISDNRRQLQLYLEKIGRQEAIGKMIESMLLSTEFAYRKEFGQGDPDSFGRRMMGARDASYALAFALTDASPDPELVHASKTGKLHTRADYEREVRRILSRRDQWYVIDESVQAANLNASLTNQPIRKLRFFREFFGYPKAMEVFKDDSRFGAGRHEQAVSRLIDEADLLVEHILEQDTAVFEKLLTSESFYIYHSGDNQTMKDASDQLRKVYEYFQPLDWNNFDQEDIESHRDFMMTIWEFKKVKGGDAKSLLNTLKRMMTALELHFGNGQKSGMPYMKLSLGFWNGGNVLGRTGQQMRGEQVTTYWNLDWRTWDYPTTQPSPIPNRKGMLTHPAWLIAHSQNLETDPIHRGKWIREKLLADTIPDVPITVDAVIPPDPHKTLRQRMENRTGDSYCWRCHQKMDPLGFPFEIYDDFGRYRTDENLESPENLIKEAERNVTNSFGASLATYKTLPVDPRGTLVGTDDPDLDGEVDDAFDLIDRLARSTKVRQSIIRHAFRYFMGRNESLSDSKALMDAERAYVESNGSFDEVIVSLLTSDSFIYRKQARPSEL